VVAVIDERDEAGSARCLEFRVHRGPAGGILGSWRLEHAGSSLVDESRPGAAAAAEFRIAVDCADQNGIPFLWVNDPEALFPPWERR
jgi:hypothetical protein